MKSVSLMLGKLAAAGLALTVSGVAMASGHPLPYPYKADVSNLPSVQRGAKIFMGYCSGCHSMKYLRYSRMGQDLQIPDDLLKANLMFTSEKVGDQIISSLPKAEAAKWFGQAPPDLTLETRARGEDWVYSYLKSFYVDPSRPMGVNNLVLPGVSMPHVLWAKQGWQEKLEENHAEAGAAERGDKAEGHGQPAKAEGEHAEGHGHASPFKLVQKGELEPKDYDKFVGDIVNFMAYAAEPGRTHRQAVGFKAIVYLLILLVFAYLLKKEYWRDVH
jgi:ubiquinol-cytochrome c reductase cytochrome c1 subunit